MLCMLNKFPWFCLRLLIIFKINIFKQFFQEYHQCRTVWIQIRPDILSGLVWVQTDCKDYQQTALASGSSDIVYIFRQAEIYGIEAWILWGLAEIPTAFLLLPRPWKCVLLVSKRMFQMFFMWEFNCVWRKIQKNTCGKYPKNFGHPVS